MNFLLTKIENESRLYFLVKSTKSINYIWSLLKRLDT